MLLQSEAHFFEPYVEGDMAAFLRYLDVKRQNAVWGDDPEVQALCEIYDRPAEIWAYDPQVPTVETATGIPDRRRRARPAVLPTEGR